MFFKIGVFKYFTILTRKQLCWSLLLTKLQALLKKTPTQVFSCGYCEIFKITFSHRTPLVAASGIASTFLKAYTEVVTSI